MDEATAKVIAAQAGQIMALKICLSHLMARSFAAEPLPREALRAFFSRAKAGIEEANAQADDFFGQEATQICNAALNALEQRVLMDLK